MQLLSGEEIVWHGRPSWRSMLAFYIKWGFVALLPGVIGQIVASASSADKYRWDLWLITIVLLLLVLFAGWLKRIGTHYTVTNQRINIRQGILSRSDHSTGYERLQNVKTYQSLLERMLKVGLVDFDTAAGGDFDFKFAGVENPEDLARQISELQRAATQTPGQAQPQHGV
jgi:uncharacterized membrane protein YdbT with pleckstrin-like domain